MSMTRRRLPLAALLLCAPAWAQDANDAPWRNPALGVSERAKDLVSRMTLEEKAGQVGHTAPAIPRLGVPAYNWWNEGLHGVARAGVATVFPQAIGLAATFDAPLVRQTTDVVSTEFRAKYAATVHPDGSADWYRGLTVWSPNINIFRDPRWGRGQETYGEDPYLTSRIGVAFVTGLQGSDPKYLKTVATVKHFAVHSGPESTRHTVDVHVSRHDLEDTYLPAFRATITEGKAQSVMCAYNSLNGEPACASGTLLDEHLRKDWRFPGYVVSDCGAAADIFRPDAHRFTADAETGVTVAFKAGMDLICGDYRNQMSTERGAIVAAVQKGLLPEATLDQALQRLFAARIELGLFDPPSRVPYAAIATSENDTPAHRELALRVAQESLVLLKNQGGVLPVKRAPGTIAVIGPNADSVDALLGNYNGTPSQPVTIAAGIRKRFPQSKVIYAEGTGLIGPVSAAVPASALCLDASCAKHGLKEERFADTALTGPPVSTGTASTIDETWSEPRAASVRWTGTLLPPESGEYRIGFTSESGNRVWIDGTLVVDDWVERDARSAQTVKLTLQARHPYALKVEHFQRGPRGLSRLVWSLPSERGDDAVEAARKADLVVMVAGLSAHIEGEEMRIAADGFAGGDRTSLDLPAPQEQLLERVHAVGKPTVLVLMNGSALGVNWADAHVPAIVEAWYPGEEGGTAVAGLLAGDFSPAGRLPVTFYKSVDQLPPFDDYSMSKRTYRYFDGTPLYPFGYGLGFTTFAYANARASEPRIGAGSGVTIAVDVSNTGGVAGDEVVQLYLTHAGVAGAPLRALRGFERVHLAPGEKRTVTFALQDRDLSIVDAAGAHRLVPGTVDVWVGGGQPIARDGMATLPGATTRFTLTADTTLPD